MKPALLGTSLVGLLLAAAPTLRTAPPQSASAQSTGQAPGMPHGLTRPGEGQPGRLGKADKEPVPLPGHRRVSMEPGKRIEDLLLPDDTDVTIEQFVVSDLSAPEHGESILAAMVDAAEFIGVGRVQRMAGRLNRNRDDIESTVTLNVSETIKGVVGRTQIAFEFPDGEAIVGKTRVRFDRTSLRLKPGDEVLVFVYRTGGLLEANQRSVFRIANGQVTQLMAGLPISQATDSNTVLADVRDVVARRGVK